VTKEYQGQKVGIGVERLNNKLVVTEVSPRGLLRNAPLVHGDTVLSINEVSFRNNPSAKEAFLVVNDAPEKVTFEILKTEHFDHVISNGVSRKSCVSVPFFCSRQRKVDHAHISEGIDKN